VALTKPPAPDRVSGKSDVSMAALARRVIGVWMVMVTVSFAQAPPAPTPAIDVQRLGPQVGSTVPDFSLPDQRGQARTLRSVMGPKGALLVFFRSADW
jgi:hypothetical protein